MRLFSGSCSLSCARCACARANRLDGLARAHARARARARVRRGVRTLWELLFYASASSGRCPPVGAAPKNRFRGSVGVVGRSGAGDEVQWDPPGCKVQSCRAKGAVMQGAGRNNRTNAH